MQEQAILKMAKAYMRVRLATIHAFPDPYKTQYFASGSWDDAVKDLIENGGRMITLNILLECC
jgi:hypothetical protein